MANAALAARLRRNAAQPVTDVERDDMAGRLNDAFTDGDLDADAYQRLLGLAFEARTLADLVPVAEQLPNAPVSNTPDIVRQVARPGELAPIRDGGSVARRLAFVAVPAVIAAAAVLVVLARLLGLF